MIANWGLEGNSGMLAEAELHLGVMVTDDP